jgi:hypothetical protein
MRSHPGQVMYRNVQTVGGDHGRRRLTARSGSSIIKLLRVFILCLAASGTARADEAAQCRANAGTFLTGNVTQGPTFAPGHLHKGVELSHTHLTLRSDQDGRSYHVAIDNVFATGYDAAGESVPAPLSTIRTGDRLELCGKLFTGGGWASIGSTPTAATGRGRPNPMAGSRSWRRTVAQAPTSKTPMNIAGSGDEHSLPA